VPYSFQWHADPTDTMYRPSPDELAAESPGFEALERRVVSPGTLLADLGAGGGIGTLAFRLGRHLLRVVTWAGRGHDRRSHMHSFLWLAHPRTVPLVLLRKRP
jgi:hypothetical protein